jgi:hypothetical protein
MTVTANTTRNDYVGNGQSVYSYTFQLNDASDVTVYLDGVVQTLNTHYTVENVGVGSGGTITFTLVDENNNPIHPTSSQAIAIVMAMDLDRDTNYQQSGLFAASDVNNDFDRLWLASNQQQTAINRSLRLQDDDATAGNMELPSKDDRKGKLLGFNATTGLPETLDNNNSNWNAAYNNMITSASFSGGNYTLTQQDGGTISTSLDGRYLPLSGGTLTGNLVFASGRISLPNLDIYNDVQDTSVIEETGYGNLIIKGTDVRIQTTSGEDVIKGEADGAVTLYYNNNAKLATTNTGISVTGTLSATGYNDNNWNTAYNDKINSVNFTSADNTLTLTQQDGTTLTTVINGSLTGGGETLAQTLAIGNTTSGNDISFGDNDKAKFGASNDLQIFHTGSYSAIRDVGTGGLFIGGENYVDIGNAGASKTYARFHKDAQVDLYHNNSVKLTTTSTGVDVTGTVTADGLTVETAQGDISIANSASSLNFARAGFNYLRATDASGSFSFITGANNYSTQRLNIANNGDISFYEDTGTTPKFFWDASAERLGIGTSSPAANLHVSSSGDTIARITSADGNGAFLDLGDASDPDGGRIVYDSGSNLALYTSSSERMRIDSSGNVGIGTTSPAQELHIASSGEADIRLQGSSSENYLDIFHNASDFGLWGTGTQVLKLATNGTERLRIDSSGNVGIGTTSPDKLLDLESSINPTVRLSSSKNGSFTANEVMSSLEFHSADTSGVGAGVRSAIRSLATDTFGSRTELTFSVTGVSSDTEAMRIDSDGNVGIGTDNPSATLEVNAGSFQAMKLRRGTSGTDANIITFAQGDGTSVGHIGGVGSGGLQLRTGSGNGTERMRIDSSGNVGIGTTSPVSIGGHTGVLTIHGDNGTAIVLKDNVSRKDIRLDDGNLSVRNSAGESHLMVTDGGNVGIGTSSPSTKLDVNGSLKASGLTYPTSDGTANQVMVTDGSGNLSFASRSLWSSGGLQYIGSSNVLVSQNTPTGNTSTAKLNVFKGNSGITPDANSTVFLDSSGSNTLQMGTGTYSTASIYFGNSFSASRAGISVSHGGGSMAFRNYGFEAMRLNSSGHLAIGTSQPSCELTVHGGGVYVSSASGTVIQGRDTSGDAYAQLVSNNFGYAGIYFGDSSDNDRAGVIYSNYSDRLDFRASGATKMSIISAGYVGINTTAPTSPLDINDNRLRIRDSKTPASATDTGNKGEICYDSNYMYVCVATNTWKRAALASW